MAAFDQGPLARYNSLTDRHLMTYFSNDRMRRHLLKNGLITKGGEVVSDAVYRVRIARREHRRRVRDLIAQAIIHKALEMERSRQIDIRKKIEEIAKIELVRRVRTDRNRVGDEECLAYFNEGDMTKRSRSAKACSRSLKSQSDYDETKLPATADQESRFRLQKLLPNEEIETKHLSQLDSLTLGEYAKIVEKQDKFRLNKLPYLGMGNEFVQNTTKPRRRKRSKPKKLRIPNKSDKDDKSQDMVLSQSARSSQNKPTSRPLVSILFNAPAGNRTFDVMVEQQPSGGNTLILYKETITNSTVFHLSSHRHKGFPFSLTFYIDNVKDSRISTCCEYKHKIGKRIGGPAGHFTLFRVDGDNPCYKCLAERDLADEKKGNKSKEELTEGCLQSNNLYFDMLNTRRWIKDNCTDYCNPFITQVPTVNHSRHVPGTKHPCVHKTSLKVRMPFVDFYAKSNEHSSSRHETISVQSTSEDPYKSEDEFESDDNSFKAVSDNEEDKKVSPRRSSSSKTSKEHEDVIINDNDLEVSARGKTPEIEVDNSDIKQNDVHKTSTNNNAVESNNEDLPSSDFNGPKPSEDSISLNEDKRDDFKRSDNGVNNTEVHVEIPKEQNGNATIHADEEEINISSSYDSSYSSDPSDQLSSKQPIVKNDISSEDDTIENSKRKFHPNNKFLLPENDESEYDTSVSDNKNKISNVNDPNSFLNKVLGYDSNSSSDRSSGTELMKKQRKISAGKEETATVNGNNKENVSDSDVIVTKYPIPQVAAVNDVDEDISQHNSEVIFKDEPIVQKLNVEVALDIKEVNHKPNSDPNDNQISHIRDNPPVNYTTSNNDHTNEGRDLERLDVKDTESNMTKHSNILKSNIETDNNSEKTEMLETHRPNKDESTERNIFVDTNISKDSDRAKVNRNSGLNIGLRDSEDTNEEMNISKEIQSPNSNHIALQKRIDSQDSEVSRSEDYSSGSTSNYDSNLNSVTQTKGLTESERMSLKIEIPKEEDIESTSKDEDKVPKHDEERIPQQIAMSIKDNEETKEKVSEVYINREERLSLQRPPSSFTSSSYFGTETESEIPIEVEHQNEEEIAINESKTIVQDNLFEQFDVFFENDDITFKKAKDKFEAIGEQRVTSLIIRNCELPSYIFNFISNKLESKKDLKRIELSGCEVEISLLKLLSKALDKWKVLETLIISNNVFVDYSLFDLVNTIEHLYSNDKADECLTLKMFDISNCALQENDYSQIINMIAVNSRVENIVLDQNPISESLWQDLREALAKNSITQTISVKNCFNDASLLSEMDEESWHEIRKRLIID